MLVLVLSAILVSAVSAQTRCCTMRQYEATFGEIGGGVYTQAGQALPTLINAQNTMHYDYYNRKLAIESTFFWPNGTNTTANVLIDYTTPDIMYMQPETGGCYQIPNGFQTSYVEQCIPDSAVHIRSSYIGYGANEIPFTTWQFLEPKNGNVIRMSVTDDGCIPLFESVFGTVFQEHVPSCNCIITLGNGNVVRLSVTDDGCNPLFESVFGTVFQGSSDLVFIVTNFRAGIRKPRLFNIPTNCPKQPLGGIPSDVRRTVEKLQKLIKF